MEKATYQFVEDRHDTYWWQRARRALVTDLLRRYEFRAHPRWLDLGCGPGGNLIIAAPFEPEIIAAVDVSPIAITQASAKAPFARIVSANIANTLPFADGSFDVVTILNVLYHEWIRDDLRVLHEVQRVLRPGGLLIVTEPAFPILKREMDKIAMTRKRYTLAEFKRSCGSAGLRVLFASYFTGFGVPVILAMKAMNRLRNLWFSKQHVVAAVDMKELTPRVNGIMYRIARLEGWAICSGFPIPFGTTLICVARNEGAPVAQNATR